MTIRKTKVDNKIKQTSINGNHDNNIDDFLETRITTQPKRKTIGERSKKLIKIIYSKGLKLLKVNG